MKVFLTLIIFNIPIIISIFSDVHILHRRFHYLSSIVMFLVNFIIVIISVFEITINGIVYTDGFDKTKFIGLCICAFILSIIPISFIWNKRRTRLLTENDIDKRYIKFTANAKAEGTIRCFARNLSFFGKIIEPCKCLYKNEDNNFYRKIMLSKDSQICDKSNKGCKNIDGLSCLMVCEQFTQLLKMKNNMKKLEILCVEPSDESSKALLGKLVYSFRDKCEVRFYDENIREGIYMFARIIITDGPSPMIWHWKVGDKYSKTQEYHRSSGNSQNEMDVLGDTLFYLVKELLWNSYHVKKTESKELRKGWLKAFYDVIGLDEEDRKWEV